MANPKGARFERDTAKYLNVNGFPNADRRVQTGRYDKGDIAGVPDLTIECKNRKRMDVPGALDEALAEQANAGTKWGVAVLSRYGYPTKDSIVAMTLEQFALMYQIVVASEALTPEVQDAIMVLSEQFGG